LVKFNGAKKAFNQVVFSILLVVIQFVQLGFPNKF